MWLKLHISYIEFRIADELYKSGFIYDVNKCGDTPSVDVIEKARTILLSSNIEGLCIPRICVHYSEININEIEQPAYRVAFKNR